MVIHMQFETISMMSDAFHDGFDFFAKDIRNLSGIRFIVNALEEIPHQLAFAVESVDVVGKRFQRFLLKLPGSGLQTGLRQFIDIPARKITTTEVDEYWDDLKAKKAG